MSIYQPTHLKCIPHVLVSLTVVADPISIKNLNLSVVFVSICRNHIPKSAIKVTPFHLKRQTQAPIKKGGETHE